MKDNKLINNQEQYQNKLITLITSKTDNAINDCIHNNTTSLILDLIMDQSNANRIYKFINDNPRITKLYVSHQNDKELLDLYSKVVCDKKDINASFDLLNQLLTENQIQEININTSKKGKVYSPIKRETFHKIGQEYIMSIKYHQHDIESNIVNLKGFVQDQKLGIISEFSKQCLNNHFSHKHLKEYDGDVILIHHIKDKNHFIDLVFRNL